MSSPEHFPSAVSDEVGLFDRFATLAARFVSRTPFFVACVVLVLIWAPSYFVIRDVDAWQLIINSTTTVVTFLLVALLQNSTHRADLAIQHKLNAIAHGLADLATRLGVPKSDVDELRAAVGLEDRESS